MSTKRYIVLGLSIVFITLLFLSFSDYDDEDSDFTGIVSDVRKSSSGYVFNLNTSSESIRCFSYVQPKEMGYYGISGSFSNNGDMFFIDSMILLE